MNVPRGVSDLHARFCGAITHRYFIRAHMSAMLVLVLVSGTLASRLLLRAGVTHMGVRYSIAVVTSYLVFFGLIRLWLAYVCRAAGTRNRRSASRAGSSDGDQLDGSWGGGGSGSSSGSGGSVGRLLGGGGGSGGGGSTGDFGNGALDSRSAVPMPMQAQAPAPGGGGSISRFFSGSRSGGGGGGGGDGDGLLLLILFVVLVAAIFGAGAYLIVQAPAILSDAAFQAVLAGGLVRTARDSHDPGWAESVLKATAIPFAIVLVLSGVFGFEAHKHCPNARSAREAMRMCVFS